MSENKHYVMRSTVHYYQ